jgi:hypothetical protein
MVFSFLVVFVVPCLPYKYNDTLLLWRYLILGQELLILLVGEAVQLLRCGKLAAPPQPVVSAAEGPLAGPAPAASPGARLRVRSLQAVAPVALLLAVRAEGPHAYFPSGR